MFSYISTCYQLSRGAITHIHGRHQPYIVKIHVCVSPCMYLSSLFWLLAGTYMWLSTSLWVTRQLLFPTPYFSYTYLARTLAQIEKATTSTSTSWTYGPCSSRLACSLPSGNRRQGGALILRGRAATVVEDRVSFLVETELFRGQVRCRPVEKCSPRWSRKQGQLVWMVIYWNMFLSYNLMDIW